MQPPMHVLYIAAISVRDLSPAVMQLSVANCPSPQRVWIGRVESCARRRAFRSLTSSCKVGTDPQSVEDNDRKGALPDHVLAIDDVRPIQMQHQLTGRGAIPMQAAAARACRGAAAIRAIISARRSGRTKTMGFFARALIVSSGMAGLIAPALANDLTGPEIKALLSGRLS
jgi:hypothetical protein